MGPFERMKSLLAEALTLSASERATFLANLSGDDIELRDELARLLAAGEELPDVLATDGVASILGCQFRAASDGLVAGQRLGPFEILETIGAGGMGTVYRARDTRLTRIVAIKVLSPFLTRNPDCRRQFEREARAISRLSHPSICTLHDIGSVEGIEYLVMEHLEGETLGQRLKRGPLPVEELLEISIAVAGALEAAHRHHIIHRDLKPENIMLTASGVKLLDFGIAKLAICKEQDEEEDGPASRSGAAFTEAAGFTGTMPYAAPEQLKGVAVDHRCDLFALGAVLHEMCCGRRAFAGRGTPLIAAILSDEVPALGELMDTVPPGLEHLVRACLEKDPEQRVQTAHDARLQLEWTRDQLNGSAPPGARSRVGSGPGRPSRAMGKIRWPYLATLALVAATAGLTALLGERSEVASASSRLPMTRFEVRAPAGTVALDTPRLAPDGSVLAFLATDSLGVSRIWLRPMHDSEAAPQPHTEEARGLFWSPDSRSLGFFTRDMIMVLDTATGAVRPLCSLPPSPNEPWANDAVWGEDGRIVFDNTATDSLLWIPASGGQPAPLTRLDRGRDEIGHCRPSLLGDRLAYLVRKRQERLILSVETPDGRRRELVSSHSRGLLSPSGQLLWVEKDVLYAQRLDLASLALIGTARPLIDGVLKRGNCGREFSISDNGFLAYRAGAAAGVELAWLDRAGRHLGEEDEQDADGNLGSRPPVLSWMGSGNGGVSPEGRWRAYAANNTGHSEIYVQSLVNAADLRQISPAGGSAPRWRDDGRELFYLSPDQELMHVVVSGGEIAVFARPERLFHLPFSPGSSQQRFAVGSGGESFLFILVAGELDTTPITVLLGWESSLP